MVKIYIAAPRMYGGALAAIQTGEYQEQFGCQLTKPHMMPVMILGITENLGHLNP